MKRKTKFSCKLHIDKIEDVVVTYLFALRRGEFRQWVNLVKIVLASEGRMLMLGWIFLTYCSKEGNDSHSTNIADTTRDFEISRVSE